MGNLGKLHQATSSSDLTPASASSSDNLKRINDAKQKESHKVAIVLIFGGIFIAILILILIAFNQ